jgi:hypothetical protein
MSLNSAGRLIFTPALASTRPSAVFTYTTVTSGGASAGQPTINVSALLLTTHRSTPCPAHRALQQTPPWPLRAVGGDRCRRRSVALTTTVSVMVNVTQPEADYDHQQRQRHRPGQHRRQIQRAALLGLGYATLPTTTADPPLTVTTS